MGRAGTGVASADGPSATHLNPALLGGDGPQIVRASYRAASFDLRGEAAGQSYSYDRGGANGAVGFGVRAPLTLLEPLSDCIGIGLDLDTPGGIIERVRILDPERPQFPLLETRAEALNFDMGFGVLLPFGVRLGAGLMAISSVRGTVTLEAGASSTVQSRVDDELFIVTAPSFGVAYGAGAIDAGLVYRGELASEFDLDVSLEDLGELVLPPIDVTGLAQVDPAQVQAEVTFRTARFEVTLGLGYRWWSKVERFKGPTVVCPEGAMDCEQPEVPRLGLVDTIVPRVAISRRFPLGAAELGVSLGYFHEPTPLGAQRGPENLWDNPRHAITLGYDLFLPDPHVHVLFALQRHFLVPRTHHKSDPGYEDRGAFRGVETTGGAWVSSVELEAAF